MHAETHTETDSVSSGLSFREIKLLKAELLTKLLLFHIIMFREKLSGRLYHHQSLESRYGADIFHQGFWPH